MGSFRRRLSGQSRRRPHPLAITISHFREGFGVPGQDRVGRLLGGEPLQVAVSGYPLRFDNLAGGEGGGADVADPALVHEVSQRGEVFLDVGAGPVDLVEVDPVGAQPAGSPRPRG
jgi:hypothetical protein